MARARRAPRPVVRREDSEEISLDADVVVVGGGPAATWAAIRALEHGARVLVVDKGYVGASGVAATAGVGHWLVPPEPELRDAEISVREKAGGWLTDRNWTNDVLDVAWERAGELPGWGYGVGLSGATALEPPEQALRRRGFLGQSPTYLRFLRARVVKLGGLILDHSPALELLRDADGVISGARGWQRQKARAWSASAGAVILATGGTTWKSHSLGGDVNTGEGHLMAAEAGAILSSMEFSNFYGMVPFGTSMDKNGFFVQASYFDEDGNSLAYENLHVSRVPLLEASLRTTVHAQFSQIAEPDRDGARKAMPNFFMVTDKLGLDPFNEPFPMDWVFEGTVRGTGGLRINDRSASVGVPGLFAAGDVTARDRLVGAATGAGGPNLAWAIATATWAGDSAVEVGVDRPRPDPRFLEPLGRAGVISPDPARSVGGSQWRDTLAVIQNEMLPIDKSALRSHDGLLASLDVLDRVWGQILADGAPAGGAERIRTREVAGMAAMARWADRAALARTESRGMHTRTDYPRTDRSQARRLLVGGLADEVWVSPDPELPVIGEQGAATASPREGIAS